MSDDGGSRSRSESEESEESEVASIAEEHSEDEKEVQVVDKVGAVKQAEKEESEVESSEEEDDNADEDVDLRHTPDPAENKKGSQEPAPAAGSKPGYNNSIFAQRVASGRVSQRMAAGSPILEDSFLTGADTLTWKSRDKYEATKLKIFTSVMFGCLYLLVLGICADAGGQGQGYMMLGRYLEAKKAPFVAFRHKDQLMELDADQISILKRGYGFACFCHLVGSFLLLWAAVRLSPFLCGATGEAQLVTQFHEWKRRMPSGKYETVRTQAARAEENV